MLYKLCVSFAKPFVLFMVSLKGKLEMEVCSDLFPGTFPDMILVFREKLKVICLQAH